MRDVKLEAIQGLNQQLSQPVLVHRLKNHGEAEKSGAFAYPPRRRRNRRRLCARREQTSQTLQEKCIQTSTVFPAAQAESNVLTPTPSSYSRSQIGTMLRHRISKYRTPSLQFCLLCSTVYTSTRTHSSTPNLLLTQRHGLSPPPRTNS